MCSLAFANLANAAPTAKNTINQKSSLYKYDEMTLPNGLQVVAIPMKNNSKVVDINIFTKSAHATKCWAKVASRIFWSI